jgi:hypothetical protein
MKLPIKWKFASDFLTSKTTHVALAWIALSVVQLVQGTISPEHAQWSIFAAMAAATIRDTIKKLGE